MSKGQFSHWPATVPSNAHHLHCGHCFQTMPVTGSFLGGIKHALRLTGTKCEGPEGHMEEVTTRSRKGPSTREGRPEAMWRLIHRRTEMLPGKERRNQGIGAQEGLVENAENKSCFFQCRLGLVISLERKGERTWKIWGQLSKVNMLIINYKIEIKKIKLKN